jgi:cytochrome c-type biogenesis protein CcsB
MNIQSYLDSLIFFLLLFVTILNWAGIIFTNFKILSELGFYGNIFANILTFLLLSLRWLNFGYFPLSNLYESLMFLVWGVTAVTIFLQLNLRVALIGAMSSPVALFIAGFATLSLPETMQAPSPLVPALKSNWLMMHVTVMMLSYASLILGSLLGIFFLVLVYSHRDKLKQQGNSTGQKYPQESAEMSFYRATAYRASMESEKGLESFEQEQERHEKERLTLLEGIDNLSYRTIGFGFPLLTLGIIAGAVWANEAWGSYWSWDPKETWALITWLVFASYLHARITRAWQGEKPAIIASIGFVVVWICYLGVNFLGKGLHTYGQIL